MKYKNSILVLILFLLSVNCDSQDFFRRHKICRAKNKVDTLIKMYNRYQRLSLRNSDIFIDTIFQTGSYHIFKHTRIFSEEIHNRILFDSLDYIFIDSLNNYSRLYFDDILLQKSFNIPTIPLSNLIYLRDKGIIIGLSKFNFNPYHIVVYNVDGELLAKKSYTT